MRVNDSILVLCDYNLERGVVLGVGPKNLKVEIHSGGFGGGNYVRAVPPEKCALPDESICVVWETWRGVNGRGGYRIERNLYPSYRLPAQLVARQNAGGSGRVEEDSVGVLNPNFVCNAARLAAKPPRRHP